MSKPKTKFGDVLLGAFDDANMAGHALRELTSAGFSPEQVDLISSTPQHQLAPYLRRPPSRAYGIAMLAGVIGGFLGYGLGATTAEAYPLITGGMPIVAPFSVGIIVFETIAMMAIVATAGTLLIGGRLVVSSGHLVDTSVLKDYPDGTIVVAARFGNAEQKSAAAKILQGA
ncbi:MAG: DUF3341 domain-containing protein [Acidobacteria bacterium]|nr:DUF3341 domain-containing protein [Acidobacteriota bacterium]